MSGWLTLSEVDQKKPGSAGISGSSAGELAKGAAEKKVSPRVILFQSRHHPRGQPQKEISGPRILSKPPQTAV